MSDQSPGARAVAAYEIDDVFLVAANCTTDPTHNPTQLFGEATYAHRISVSDQVLLQTRTPQDSTLPTIYLIRYVITGEVKLLRPGIEVAPDSQEVADSDVAATIQLIFAADYRCSQEQHSDQDAIGAFGRNAVFHVWPYWREAVHELASRMRLPKITVPMWKPRLGK